MNCFCLPSEILGHIICGDCWTRSKRLVMLDLDILRDVYNFQIQYLNKNFFLFFGLFTPISPIR